MNTVADPAPLVRVRDCIARDYTRPLPLSLLAQEAGCSPFHLLRAFRRHYGVTPRAYQQRLRLERALGGDQGLVVGVAGRGGRGAGHAREREQQRRDGLAHHRAPCSCRMRKARGVTP